MTPRQHFYFVWGMPIVASESTVHLARETGVAFVGAGHHATERYGVQALGEAVARQFGIRVEFIDIDNPV